MTTGITLSTSGTFIHTNPFTVTSSIYATDGHAVVVYGSFDQSVHMYYSPPPWTIVNEATIGTKSKYYSAVYFGAGGQLTNSGRINEGVRLGANNQRTFASAVVLNSGTSISGHGVAAGYIGGYGYGVALRYFTAAAVTNFGTIRSTGTDVSFGVLVKSGNNNAIGTIANGSSDYGGAYIGGNVGVYLVSGTVTNFGTIKGSLGIQFSYGLGTGGTVINAGTIIGSGVHGAVNFGFGANRLVIDPGAVFDGVVRGHNLYHTTNALELATGASAGTLTGLGVNYYRFNQVTVDAGANWHLAGNNASYRNGTFAVDGTLNVATAASFSNQGTLLGAVTVQAGGSLYNAYNSTIVDTGDNPGAVVGAGAGAVVTNHGTVASSLGTGVRLQDTGSVVNGDNFQPNITISGYSAGVDLAAAGASIANYALIEATGLGGNGIRLDDVGTILNVAGGAPAALISGYIGIYATVGGSIANDATIRGSGNAGVRLGEVGTIVNGATSGTLALIAGDQDGILLDSKGSVYGDASIANFGSIAGTHGTGLYLKQAYGVIVNGATTQMAAAISGLNFGIEAVQPVVAGAPLTITNFGTIMGGVGISSLARTTLTNAGTIVGNGGTAVALGGTSDVVVVEPGGKFVGRVKGGPTDRFELAGTVPATLTGVGVAVANFGTLTVDANAIWDLAGSATIGAGVSFTNNGTIQANAGDHVTILADMSAPVGPNSALQIFPGATISAYGNVAAGQTLSFATSTGGELQIGKPDGFAGTISGFVPGTTIDLPGITASSAGVIGGVLTVRAGGGVAAALPVTGSFANQRIASGPDGYGGTLLTVVNNVACFAAGTRIATASGEVAVEDLLAGDRVLSAFGGVVPVVWMGHRTVDCHRHPRPQDVWPIRVRADAFGAGLPRRDLLLSPDHAVYVGDVLIPIRHLVNGATIAPQRVDAIGYWHVELPSHDVLLAEELPAESSLDTGNRGAFENGGSVVQAHPDFALRVWETQSCAPLLVSGPALAAVKSRLLARAQALGFTMTTDPDLRLVVNGQTLRLNIDGSTCRFVLPRGAREIRLASRSVTPAFVSAESTDHRRIGVAVAGLWVDGEAVPPGDPRRASGWHEAEEAWQWTNGDASLACAGARRVEVTLMLFQRYWDTDAWPRDDVRIATR